jgi:hypothetical protein
MRKTELTDQAGREKYIELLSDNLGEYSKLEFAKKTIDVSQYQDGIYFITIQSENEYEISKFVVKH